MRTYLLIAILCSSVLQAQDKISPDLKERPLSHIYDPTNWLPRDTKDDLEDFLRIRSNDYNSELFLLLAPQPAFSSDESKLILQELGNSWSSDDWAIISYNPEQVGTPIIVTGGPFHKDINIKSWEYEIQLLQELSLQSWNDKPEIDYLVHKVSDSLTFSSRANDALVQKLVKNWKKVEEEKLRIAEEEKIRNIFIAFVSLASLIIISLILWKIHLRRRKMYFPKTKWQKRLGAPSSGGSTTKHQF